MLPFPIISSTNIIRTRKIKKIITNSSVLYVLFANGNLYCLGSNLYGEFGTGKASTSTISSTWTLSRTGVQDIWTGYGTSVLLLNNGSYEYTGLTRIIGTVSDASYVTSWSTFSALNNFMSANSGLTVKTIQMGGQSIGIHMSNDSLYCMGYQSQGQFGIGSSANFTYPVLSRVNVSNFCMGAQFQLVVDKGTSVMFKAGWNQYGQIGAGAAGATANWVETPYHPTALYCTAGASMFVDSTGLLYGSGEYTFGQLDAGLLSGQTTTYFNITSGLPSASVLLGTKGSTSTVSSFVWFKIGSSVYAIGQNASGGASVGSSNNLTSYTPMLLPSGYTSSDVDSIWAIGPTGGQGGGQGGTGTGASFMLSKDDKLWCSGDYNYFSAITSLSTNQLRYVELALPAGE